MPLLNCGLIFGAGQAVAIRILFGQMGHDLTPTNPKHHRHHHVGPWRQGDPSMQPYHKMLLKKAYLGVPTFDKKLPDLAG